ncbi:hypothetical protein EDD86DRAFT_270787 [Gorgonomyces haynaldii]|nr:hypothetical protein EDD86DRAFT_270787 [Gorgonomyces haynaldii]
MIIVIQNRVLRLHRSRMMAVLVLSFSLVYQLMILAFYLIPSRSATFLTSTTLGIGINMLTGIIIPLSVCLELEYVKLISVIGFIQPKTIKWIQIGLLIYGGLTFSVIAVIELVLLYTDKSGGIFSLSKVIAQYANLAFASGIFLVEFSQLIYTYVTVRMYVTKQKKLNNPSNAFFFVNWILLLSVCIDIISLIMSLVFLFVLEANIVLVIAHLPLSCFTIHNFNALLLPKSSTHTATEEAAKETTSTTIAQSETAPEPLRIVESDIYPSVIVKLEPAIGSGADMTDNSYAVFQMAINFLTGIIIPLSVCLELEYVKLISVIGFIKAHTIRYIQIGLMSYGFLTLCCLSITYLVFTFIYSMRYAYALLGGIAVYANLAFATGVFLVEFAQLIYTYVSVRKYVTEKKKHNDPSSAFFFINWILVLSVFVDLGSIILSLVFGYTLEANIIVVSAHLPLSCFTIHHLNMLLLPKSPTRPSNENVMPKDKTMQAKTQSDKITKSGSYASAIIRLDAPAATILLPSISPSAAEIRSQQTKPTPLSLGSSKKSSPSTVQ